MTTPVGAGQGELPAQNQDFCFLKSDPNFLGAKRSVVCGVFGVSSENTCHSLSFGNLVSVT